MWRLWNWLFGWHYVLVHDCRDFHTRRVRRMQNGTLLGNKIVGRNFMIDPNGKATGAWFIREWWPLTWKERTYADAVAAADRKELSPKATTPET